MESGKSLRSENVFVKRIFDKDTGKSLACHLHQGESENWQTFSIGWWSDGMIRYDQVMDLVVEALRKEKQDAIRIRDLLDSREAVLEKAQRMQFITDKARSLFEAMTEIEAPDLQYYMQMKRGEMKEEEYQSHRSEILDQLAEKDAEYAACVEKMDEQELVFSRKNPWIKMYGSIEVPDTLSRTEVRKWLDRVLVKDLSSVEIVLPENYACWKEQLPTRWKQEGR